MKTPTRLLLALFAISLTLLSCDDSDNEEEVVVDPPVFEENPIPDQISTYTGDVKAIIDTNCLECHGSPTTQGAPMSLVTFDQVVEAVNNRDLFGRISTTNDLNVMPPLDNNTNPPTRGRLPDATILIVEDWIADGLLVEE